MLQRRKILNFTSGLLLLVFSVLFLHSETPLFDNHNDECENVDICLIMNRANFDNHFDINENIKIVQTSDFPVNISIPDDLKLPVSFHPSRTFNLKLITESLILSNCILRI